jgi:chromosome segregation ATPase
MSLSQEVEMFWEAYNQRVTELRELQERCGLKSREAREASEKVASAREEYKRLHKDFLNRNISGYVMT